MQGLSERQYAAHVGLSRGAIQKAKEAGRLVLHTDGSIDAAASDARPGGVDRFRPADEVMHLSAASVNLQVPA
jgi:hypothetical protein